MLYVDSSSTYGEIRVFGFGRSIVARRKLEGIDARTPPGVELAA